MLKFIKHHMATIVDIEIFPIISLVIFFTFFTMMIIYTIGFRKKHLVEMANKPLEDDQFNNIDA